MMIINDSDAVVYIKINGDNAELNKGIRLNANGGAWEMTAALSNLSATAIKAIHGGTGSKTLLITEGV